MAIMHNQSIQELCQKVDRLLQHCEDLQRNNTDLVLREQQWQREKVSLLEKNELALARVEAMIVQLKTLRQTADQTTNRTTDKVV